MFTLPKLPYAFDALEPYIDAQTMEIHYTKHHQTYINNLNEALKTYPDLQNKSLGNLLTSLDALPASIKTQVRNNGGGDYNHTLFWSWMKASSADSKPRGKSAQAINTSFSSFEQFKESFSQAAKKVFGSGWAWLSFTPEGTLIIEHTSNQDSPIMHGNTPI